jgi:hypothetical protein
MTKRRLLSVLAILVLINLVMVNQIWLSATAGEAATLIELTGNKVSNLISPVLILVALSVFVGWYLNGKAAAILLLIEAALVASASVRLASNLANPAAAIAASGQIEKITGLTGTSSELAAQLSQLTVSPSFSISIVTLIALALWMPLTSVFAWRWKKVGRVASASSAKVSTKQKDKKGLKTSFDLWDSQR